jgi:uncharacterized membrane protein (UPF0127 family)
MKIKLNSKSIIISNVKKLSHFGKVIGLMFSRREKAEILLFEFKKPVKMRIHSFFVFYNFIALWLDDKNNVVDLKIVKPFSPSGSSKKPFYKLVEIPINERYSTLCSVIVGDKKYL